MGLLARLRGQTQTTEYDPLADGHSVSDYALGMFHNVVADLEYANDTYRKVQQEASKIIRHHEDRMKQAATRQVANNNVIAKIKDLVGEAPANAGNEDAQGNG